mgnify:FL=1|jgi:hypothetical protein
MTLQLFAVRKYPYGPVLTDADGKVICFDSKPEAKMFRNNSLCNHPDAVVTSGPAHSKYIAGDM